MVTIKKITFTLESGINEHHAGKLSVCCRRAVFAFLHTCAPFPRCSFEVSKIIILGDNKKEDSAALSLLNSQKKRLKSCVSVRKESATRNLNILRQAKNILIVKRKYINQMRTKRKGRNSSETLEACCEPEFRSLAFEGSRFLIRT
jgi:hypothetical protein